VRRTLIWLALSSCLVLVSHTVAADDDVQQPAPPKKRAVTVTIYPILVQAPIFGANVDLPSIGGGGGGGGGESGDQSGSTDTSLNAAYMTGATVEADRWFAEILALWANVSANHPTPRVAVTSDVHSVSGRAGVRLFKGVSATVGFRYMSANLDATLTLPNLGITLEGTTKPSLWDPLIGADWRADFGDKWTVNAYFQGGGFGVGTDVDLAGDAHANWHVTRHVDLRFGYTVLHFKMTVADVHIGSFQRTLIATQTLQGPDVGLGIVF